MAMGVCCSVLLYSIVALLANPISSLEGFEVYALNNVSQFSGNCAGLCVIKLKLETKFHLVFCSSRCTLLYKNAQEVWMVMPKGTETRVVGLLDSE